MRDEAQRVHLLAVQEHVHLHELRGLVVRELVVEGGVALRAGFQGVEKVVDYLVERHHIVQLHQPGVEILHVLVLAAAVLAEGHDVAHELLRRDDGDVDIGLPGLGDGGRVRVVVRVV